jgi:hypothetical protein
MGKTLRGIMVAIGLATGWAQAAQAASLCTGTPADLVIITTSDLTAM